MEDNEKDKKIEYKVDGEAQFTTEREMTPRQILVNAGIDPENYYLDLVKGGRTESYKDCMDKSIRMHPGIEFISVYTGPSPVSCL